MNVQDTVKKMLMLYPSITLNALDAYEHLFCVIGNGYEWKDGELVELCDPEDAGVPTLQKAIYKVLRRKLLDNPAISLEAAMFVLNQKGDDEKDNTKQCIEELFKRTYKSLNEDLSLIFRTEERMNDFEPHTAERYPEVRHIWPVNIYELCEYSEMCCLPDDIKPDWLEAAEKMYGFVKTHRELWSEDRIQNYEEWLPKVEARIKELKRKK